MIKKLLITAIMLCYSMIYAQSRDSIVSIPYGNLDSWITRQIKDSRIIGGKIHTMDELSFGDHFEINTPFKKKRMIPWRTSNVFADVGVSKGSATVTKERRADGYCVRMETKLEEVKVLGMFNIKVVAAGSLFLGDIIEPITSMKNAIKNIVRGVSITQKPKAIIFDYKYYSAGERVYANGLGDPTPQGDKNLGEAVLFLQKRWEDANGNIYARRIATANVRLDDTKGKWIDGYKMSIVYGDITKNPMFVPYINLMNTSTPKDFQHYTINSKGVPKQIVEVEWGSESDTPTHMFLIFSSSQNGAYVGAPGSLLWVDNIKMVL